MGVHLFSNIKISTDLSQRSTGLDGTIFLQMSLSNEEEGKKAEINFVESNLWKVSGPQFSSQKSIRIVNGQKSVENIKNYTYSLVPLKTGKLKSPEFYVLYDSKRHSPKRYDVFVTEKSNQSQAQQKRKKRFQPFGGLFNDDDSLFGKNPFKDDFFEDFFNNDSIKDFLGQGHFSGNTGSIEDIVLVAAPSKNEVYVGELIQLPYYVYYSGRSLNNTEYAQFPAFKDFLKEELYLPRHWTSQRTVYNGKQLSRSEIVRYAIFPLKSGELIVDPLKIRVRGSAFFSGANQRATGEGLVEKSSGALIINVKELPPVPEGMNYSGNVGQYSVQRLVEDAQIKAGEPFVLKYEVSGLGNIKSIQEPMLSLPASFQKKSVKSSVDYKKDSTGKKTFNFLMIAKNAGQFKVAPEDWVYFNPETEAYETVELPELEISVQPGIASNESSQIEEQNNAFPSLEDQVSEKVASTQDWRKRGFVSKKYLLFLLGLFLFFLILKMRNFLIKQWNEKIIKKPWLPLEKKLLKEKRISAAEAASFSDRWLRLRFGKFVNADYLALDLNRDDFLNKLKEKISVLPEDEKKLKEIWNELDSHRYLGKKDKIIDSSLFLNKVKEFAESVLREG